MTLLELYSVSREFGGLAALCQVNMVIPQGHVVGLIGPNGAGKTTLLNCISGLDAPTAGEIIFDGKPIHQRPPHRITALGVSRTYQNIRLFKDMTALDNVIVGQHVHGHSTLLHSLFVWPYHAREEKRFKQQALSLLQRFGIEGVQAAVGELMLLNRYSYVAGNPTNLVDPSGMIAEKPGKWDR